MKNLYIFRKGVPFLLFLFFGLFVSCASDDSVVEVKSDPIVGDWERQKEVYVFEDDSVVVHNFPQCSETNFLVFMDEEYDRFFSLYLYSVIGNTTSSPCQLTTGSGTWTKISNEKYSVNVEYFEENDPYNIGEETILYRASFPAPDSLYLHNRNKLEEYQLEMENLQDFYTVYALDDGGIDHTPYLP